MNKRKKKKEFVRAFDFDLENTVYNRYTDNRVSETFSVCVREILIDKLYKTIASGKKYNYEDSTFLKSFLGEPQFFRNIKDFITFLNEKAEEGNILAYAHNLIYELDYILRETNASTIITDDKNFTSVFRSNNSPIKVILRQEKEEGKEVEFENLDKIEFRCSYALSGYSIKVLGDIFGLPKLQYDYEKIRRATDELTKEDKEYNDVDVVISGMRVIQEALRRREKLEELPMTTTSEMNNNKLKFIEKNYGKEALEKLKKERSNRLDIIDYDFYNLVMSTRQGGLTTTNEACFNQSMKDVFSIDITSSYPYEICNARFPIYTKECYYNKGETEEQIFDATILFKEHLEGGKAKRPETVKGWFAWLSLINVRPKKINGEDFPLLPISVSKCEKDSNINFYDNCIITKRLNGKVINADRIHYKCNDVDYEQLLMACEFEVEMCFTLCITEKDMPLSPGEINFIFNLFKEKQTIKPYKDERQAEYMHIKGNINSNYGRKQMDIIREEIYIEKGNIHTKSQKELLQNVSGQGLLNDINKHSSSIDIPTDGCYIPSMAKLRLMEKAKYLLEMEQEINKELGSNYKVNIIYSDTDSLKYNIEEVKLDEKKVVSASHTKTTNTNKGTKVTKQLFTNILLQKIEIYNQKIIKNNKENYRFKIDYIKKFNLDINDKNISEILQLGTWDIENRKNPKYDKKHQDKEYKYIPYTFFKTLGAKKYCYIDDDKIVTTISGCSTKLGNKIRQYCIDNGIEDYKEVLQMIFNPYTIFDRSLSGRTVAYSEKRNPEEMRNIIIDGIPLVGNGGKMIENSTYTLGLTENDFQFIDNMVYVREKERKEKTIEIGLVFLETSNGKIVLLENPDDIRQYFIDSETIKRDYIYKDYIDGELILNNNFNEGDNND